jgi:hypothetical protein
MALLALLVFALPLMICMPLTLDTINYDICARTVLRGGVMYRDAFDNNLPGVVWIHCAVRGLLGDRSEAMRGFDLVVFAAVIGLLLWWLALAGRSRISLVVIATLLFAFYSSRWEWCHCQRDTWMLVPTLFALHLRRMQVDRLRRPEVSAGRLALGSIVEGLVWGSAVWIKPHVIVPALTTWIVASLLVRGAPVRVGRRVGLDAFGLLIGGLVVGAAGFFWLYRSGAWPYFWQISTDWNKEYYTSQGLTFYLKKWAEIGGHFLPWSLALPVALVLAVVALRRSLPRVTASRTSMPGTQQALFAAFFLGWTAQVFFLQRMFDYIYFPAVLLSVAFLSGLSLPNNFRRELAVVIVLVTIIVLAIIVAVVLHPLIWRAGVWTRCWREGSTPELRETLSLDKHVDWADEARVTDFLRGRVGDGELTCYDPTIIPLYWDLRVEPSTRYIYLWNVLFFFHNHVDEIQTEVRNSRQRYVVTDVNRLYPNKELPKAEKDALPADGPTPEPVTSLAKLHPTFPWSEPIVFRSGKYLVHRVRE